MEKVILTSMTCSLFLSFSTLSKPLQNLSLICLVIWRYFAEWQKVNVWPVKSIFSHALWKGDLIYLRKVSTHVGLTTVHRNFLLSLNFLHVKWPCYITIKSFVWQKRFYGSIIRWLRPTHHRERYINANFWQSVTHSTLYHTIPTFNNPEERAFWKHFFILSRTNFTIWITFNLSSANAFNLDGLKFWCLVKA